MLRNLSFCIESIYSTRVYKWLNMPLSIITGLLPFSLAEIIVYMALLFIIYKLTVFVKDISNNSKKILDYNYLKKFIKNTFFYIIILYLAFIIIWGLNYYRQSFSETIGIKTSQYSKSDLENLCLLLINNSNLLRKDIREDKNGVMIIENGVEWVLENATTGYDIISKSITSLSGSYGKPKPILLSKLMCYTGIVGIYFPLTGEANINICAPAPSLPSIVAHEMAHQRGYARENEANFISFLACVYNPYTEFKYSGFLLALTYSMNALRKEDLISYKNLITLYSDGLSRDITYINKFWKRYEGPIEKFSTDVNNAYLKANNQKDGIKSYGKMVDLLIAYYMENEH